MNTSFISTQQIKDLINEQKFTSTKDIMDCMKNMFADVLEQTLQAEMDQHLGYEHAERRNDDAKKNYRNGSVKRTMKTQLGEVEVNVPRDRNGEFEPKIISKYQRNADGIEERILSLYAAGMSEYSGVAEPCFPLKEPPNIPVKRANLSANESQ